MAYELVIFDNDGVLVDSEPLSNGVLAEYLTELGYPTTVEDSYRDFMGTAAHRVHDVIAERYDGALLPEGFDESFHGRVFDTFTAELAAVRGAETLLKELRQRSVPYCLASSAHHSWIRAALDVTGLRGWFPEERIFSAQDVGVGKPSPGPVPARRPHPRCRPGRLPGAGGQPERRARRPRGRYGRVRLHRPDRPGEADRRRCHRSDRRPRRGAPAARPVAFRQPPGRRSAGAGPAVPRAPPPAHPLPRTPVSAYALATDRRTGQ